jgi:hypothetical protein
MVVSGDLVVRKDGAQRYEDKPVPPARPRATRTTSLG